MSPLLALLSAAVVGGADFLGGVASRETWPVRVAARAQGIGLAVSLPIAIIFGADDFTANDAAWSLGSGLAVGVGLALFYTAMALGQISIAAPTAAVSGAILPVAVALARGERPGVAAVVGIAGALVAVTVVSIAPAHETVAAPRARRALVLAIGAGACFGLFLVCLAEVGGGAGMWPVPLSRLVSAGVLGLATLGAAESRPSAPRFGRLAAAIGILEVVSLVALVIAFRHGPLAVTSVLASLYPVTTVLLAAGLLHERLTRLQLGAVALALASVVLISTGPGM